MECSAFSAPFKVLATALVTAAVAWGWHMWANGLIEATLASSGWLQRLAAEFGFTSQDVPLGKDHHAQGGKEPATGSQRSFN